MTDETDPFALHPELRDKIADPLQSMLRGFSPDVLAQKMQEMGLPGGWWHSDEVREASRAQVLAARPAGALWVFAYGSLMWNPAFRFAEVRRARVAGFSRRFILKDVYGGRGDEAAPGLMAALDIGDGCDGLAFRIAEADVDEETEVIWRREMIAPAYKPEFVPAALSDRTVMALTFVADHDARMIEGDLSRAEQVAFCATGSGFLGTSLEYLENIASHFALLGIVDDEVSALLAETLAHRQTAE